jgi:Zn-dependent oligopeptidase
MNTFYNFKVCFFFFFDYISLNDELDFALDNFASKSVYHAVKEYLDMKLKEPLKDDENYYLSELSDYYQRAGYMLSDEKFAEVTAIKKEVRTINCIDEFNSHAQLGKLSLEFDTNIAEDASNISVPLTGLLGCDDQFIKNLKRDGENYVLGVDYPTYREIMAHCEVQETRRQLYIKFNNRAYPKNRDILVNMVKKRDSFAKALGYPSFSHLDIDSEMAKNPG